MSRTLPLVLSARDLPAEELQAARLDGQVVALASGWCTLDVADTPAVRTAAVSLLLPRQAIGDRWSAAWVWGALTDPPAVLTGCVPAGIRVAMMPGRGQDLREATLDQDETQRFDDGCVTTPLRTLVDLAREQEHPDRARRVVLRLLRARTGLPVAEVLKRIDARPRLRWKGRVLAALGETL